MERLNVMVMNKQILELAKEAGFRTNSEGRLVYCGFYIDDELTKFAELLLANRVPDGWRFYTADNSIVDKCSVMFMRTDVKAWHDQHDTYSEEISADEPPLYIQGIGANFNEAFSDAKMKAKVAKPLIVYAPKGADK